MMTPQEDATTIATPAPSALSALLHDFGISVESAKTKIESRIATLQRELAQIDERRSVVTTSIADARRQHDLLTGRTGATARGTLKQRMAQKRNGAPASDTGDDPVAAPEAWDPATIVARQQTGKLPSDPVRVHEYSSEKLARARLLELHRAGYAHSSTRPLAPGQLDFLRNRHGWMLFVVAKGGAA